MSATALARLDASGPLTVALHDRAEGVTLTEHASTTTAADAALLRYGWARTTTWEPVISSWGTTIEHRARITPAPPSRISPRDAAILRAHRNGTSVGSLAIRYGLNPRYVRHLIAAAEAEE